MYSKIFESTKLEHLLIRKVFTALLDQVRSKVMFSIDSHNFGLFCSQMGCPLLASRNNAASKHTLALSLSF